jgi:hypothetical protein
MKILFVMRNTVYVRNFESTLRLLAVRGHQVHIAAEPHRFLDDSVLLDGLTAGSSAITYAPLPDREPHGWTLFAEALRRAVDTLRYYGSEYDAAPKLRARAERGAPAFVAPLLRTALVRFGAVRWLVSRWIRAVEPLLPRDPAVDRFVAEHAPDLVLVTPLVEPGNPQAEYVRSARALGVPAGLCVFSWDNLTNKGLIQESLDVVTVWNEPMRREAIELHGVPEDRVVVTGAPAYDHWFSWQSSTTRKTFCAKVGLPPEQPYLLYLCSSNFIAPDEVPFVREWVRRLREMSPLLRETSVLVRPHPQNAEVWKDVDFSDLGGVAIWPRGGRNPVDVASRSEYFDSIYRSVGVVGVNTSALIESAIVGRKVHTLLAPEFRETQEGTLHFRHLVEAGGGLLHVARDFAEHVAQLEESIRTPKADAARVGAFLGCFVRPFGLNEPATPRLVDVLERTAARKADRAATSGVASAIARAVLAPVAARYERVERQRRDEEARQEQAKRDRAVATAARHNEKQRASALAREARAARDLWKQQLRELKAEKEAQEQQRRADEAARAFENYQVARDRIARMREREQAFPPDRHPAEQRVIAALQHIWDASPETIAALRRHTAPIAGTGPADYVTTPEARKAFLTDLGRLLKTSNPALLVAEPSMLGGFGHVVSQPPDGEVLYNDDSMKFFEVLTALDSVAVLDEFAANGRRGVVWEIGGGYGGFAYQFRTLFPHAAYVVTAAPEPLLFSAVYLMTAFPDARCRFYDPDDPAAFWHDLQAVDFAFATEQAIGDAPRNAGIDLTLDIQALERMTPERACRHVQAAFTLGSRHVYSLGPRGAYPDVTPVTTVLERAFWLHLLPVPQFAGMKVLDGFRRPAPPDGVERAHRIGWKRMRVS